MWEASGAAAPHLSGGAAKRKARDGEHPVTIVSPEWVYSLAKVIANCPKASLSFQTVPVCPKGRRTVLVVICRGMPLPLCCPPGLEGPPQLCLVCDDAELPSQQLLDIFSHKSQN